MCRCRYIPSINSNTFNNYIKVTYLGIENILKGKSSQTVYGKRKNGQTFYVLEEDYDETIMRRN